MEHLPEQGLKCDMCSAAFVGVDQLAAHRLSHTTSTVEDKAPTPGSPDIGTKMAREGLRDNLGPRTPTEPDGTNTDDDTSRKMEEEQRNDSTNAGDNRQQIENYTDDSQRQVNPNQTPTTAKAIRPIDSV